MNQRSLRKRVYKKKGGPIGIGLRCKSYCPGCPVCESYRFYDQHGRFPTYEEVSPICDEECRKDHFRWLQTEEGKAWIAGVPKRQARQEREQALREKRSNRSKKKT